MVEVEREYVKCAYTFFFFREHWISSKKGVKRGCIMWFY